MVFLILQLDLASVTQQKNLLEAELAQVREQIAAVQGISAEHHQQVFDLNYL